MLSPDTTFGTYTIRETIGQGGMGTVYRAFDGSHDREVALKLLNEDLAASAEYREKLAEEARLSALVDSPYVAAVWETGEVDAHPYIVMEYVAGPDLRAASAQLSVEEKLDVAIMIAKGIDAAHQQGLVHRDLKPENIKLTEDNTPKILDFGLAREVDPDQIDEEGNIEGTLYYFAPEQLCGEPMTPRSDLFSYGAVLYELFCGCRPFDEAYAAGIIYGILHEEPAAPSELDAALPAWFDGLTSRLMAKRPDDRFESMAVVIAYMEESRRDGGAPTETVVKPRQTVTVIDLKNLSGDDQWDYFCEGFTDDVIREVSRRTDLVVSAEPATTYRRNIRETFDQCRSEFVVVGSLMKWQERIKLSLAIHADRADSLVWSETYTQPADDLFEVLAQAAKDASLKLSEQAGRAPVMVDEEFRPDVTAYDFYLKGKAYYQTNKPDDLAFAEQMFRNALEIDPDFALAHSGLSDVHAFQYMAFYDRTPERIDSARRAAERAIEIDPKLPEAHRSLARFYMFTGDMVGAEEALHRTIDLGPKYAIGYRTLAWLKHSQRDLDSATAWARKALELAPTDLETLLLLSLLAINRKQFSVALSTLQRAIELGPDYGRAYHYLGQVYLKLGVLDSALANFDLAHQFKGDPNSLIEAGYIHLARGNLEQAREKFRESVTAGYFPFVARYFLGLIERTAGDTEESERQLNLALQLTEEFDLKLAENREVVVYRAMILAALGRADEARSLVVTIDEEPDDPPEITRNIARCWALLGESAKAVHYLAQAVVATTGPTKKEAAIDPHFTDLSL